ncbi:hypothetical protein LBBP_01822 [Leptospira borgpetersenii serovar Ballum]|uniref:Uncharacterized protein n=1 Tax=Leptospira borgpetersenii serovar Ballum TaxID=280505 RepID=A0A0S2IRF8_LEPBO|nr:hypothetical protein LBBP_01822 [Leptospira borgpetersenii serovar Ballum]
MGILSFHKKFSRKMAKGFPALGMFRKNSLNIRFSDRRSNIEIPKKNFQRKS